ncbi:hypothetical protein SNE40_014486 [Patella caerulea]|uniref:Secreted protein n=1 Tax=Patella caerulea TaxID=87958 RepID=A0AAN8JES6_PATCE
MNLTIKFLMYICMWVYISYYGLVCNADEENRYDDDGDDDTQTIPTTTPCISIMLRAYCAFLAQQGLSSRLCVMLPNNDV